MIKEKFIYWDVISLKFGQLASHISLGPNFYTWMTLPTAIAGYMLIYKAYVLSGFLFFLLSGLLDIFDGGLARYRKKTSAYGAYLDGCLDRFVDALLLFSYFNLSINPLWFDIDKWLCAASFVMLMPSFIVAYANHRQAVPDPTERVIWRLLNRGEMYVLMLSIVLISIYSAKWSGYLLAIFVILAAVTTIQTFLEGLYYAARWHNGNKRR